MNRDGVTNGGENIMKHEIGCYGDGSFGHQHCRERLAKVYDRKCMGRFREDLTNPWEAEVSAALRGSMPDDAWDEDAALDALNEAETRDYLFWGFQDGDFGLWVDWDGFTADAPDIQSGWVLPEKPPNRGMKEFLGLFILRNVETHSAKSLHRWNGSQWVEQWSVA